jgi:hypothetical protein
VNKHVGSTLESLFEELGERAEIELLAAKKIVAGSVLGQALAAPFASRYRTSEREAGRRSQTPTRTDSRKTAQ